MAKTIHEVSAPSVANSNFKLKPALITMVQASPFCAKAHEDAVDTVFGMGQVN
jgi:hypothetical protein